MKNARGFTLIEMMVTMILIGIVSIIVSPVLGEMTSSRIAAYRAHQTAMNEKNAQAFVTWAATISPT
ncbi:type II secretion system protein, partial [Escherichia coli]|uniref:type II secretion system protein n=1 Tax=Escherichia coli TaxID=562 RepID=UPI000CA7E5C4